VSLSTPVIFMPTAARERGRGVVQAGHVRVHTTFVSVCTPVGCVGRWSMVDGRWGGVGGWSIQGHVHTASMCTRTPCVFRNVGLPGSATDPWEGVGLQSHGSRIHTASMLIGMPVVYVLLLHSVRMDDHQSSLREGQGPGELSHSAEFGGRP
jgi:hypothetical protein